MSINELQHVHRAFANRTDGLFLFIHIFYKLNVTVSYIYYSSVPIFFFMTIITIVIIIYHFRMMYHFTFLIINVFLLNTHGYRRRRDKKHTTVFMVVV